ncbi:hypothetical protein [Jannaschia seohaensis]|uniref:Uncharacterized protein n=1 Tax=Jannaschia seohaensis TaxID=475081 RepID=A0A2Y9AG80_9RHOB|nr:hypothetical protein [Jannaschia seohaensis]PWJ20927.1 hypothetical protein BCF38_102173 [Jannaschia seohaensis]SSA41337.1 hypothetical protein SAMN05421539_102173 [Jannaschia seohaensis]
MPIITSHSIDSYNTSTGSLLGEGISGEAVSTYSLDDFVLRIDEATTIADIDLFALGALRATLDVSLAFGVIVSVSLGTPPNFSMGADIAMRTHYDNILFEQATVTRGADLRRDEDGRAQPRRDLRHRRGLLRTGLSGVDRRYRPAADGCAGQDS